MLRRISLLLPWFALVLSLTSIGAALAVPSPDARARELASHRPAAVLAALRVAHHLPVSVKPEATGQAMVGITVSSARSLKQDALARTNALIPVRASRMRTS